MSIWDLINMNSIDNQVFVSLNKKKNMFNFSNYFLKIKYS